MRTWCLLFLAGLAGQALAEEAVSSSPAAGIEEVVVPGRTPDNLRLEIERVEVAVYERFNALNSNDDFDIHCFEQAPTGSNIPLRTCAPNFVIKAESRAMSKILVDGRSSSANNNNPAERRALMEVKSRELTAEMQRLALEDEQLLRDLTRLAELNDLQAKAQEERRSKR